ncbi:hypothetical protein C2G38_2074583 [Gigaspora rosea]|uniref:Uncharacterized protein n=1 Tax=Gigaspora rosea TaxID=44941 RepID=A0A397VP89_9GLOM|nr:hypothetical protein C2G38_2074583 [Gigaspora rosea]
MDKNWVKQLISQNNYRTKIIRNNRSVFVHDVSHLSILPEHGLIENALQEQNPVYIKLYVPELDSDIEKKVSSFNSWLSYFYVFWRNLLFSTVTLVFY